MTPSRSGSFRLFRVAGIAVYLHWSWFLVAFLQIAYRPVQYSTRAWNVAEYLTLFGIVLLHEFGHALACRSVGGTARTIVLWPLGGVAFVSPPARPGAVLWSIAAGPLVNVVLLPLTVGLVVALGAGEGLREGAPDLHRYLLMITVLNGFLLAFNLLPVYPLDGGQILWSLLWFGLGRWRSLQVVSIIGMVLGGLAVLLAVAAGWFWLGLIAAFVVYRSVAGFQQAREVLHVEALPRRGDAACPGCGTGPPLGPYWVCDHCETRFDLFAANGSCPGCGAWYADTPCPDCGRKARLTAWFSGDRAPENQAVGESPPEAAGTGGEG